MISNLERYKKDLDQLIADGELLLNSMQKECLPEQFEEAWKKVLKTNYKDFVKKKYQVFQANIKIGTRNRLC